MPIPGDKHKLHLKGLTNPKQIIRYFIKGILEFLHCFKYMKFSSSFEFLAVKLVGERRGPFCVVFSQKWGSHDTRAYYSSDTTN